MLIVASRPKGRSSNGSSHLISMVGFKLQSEICNLKSEMNTPLLKLARGVAIIMFARARLEGKNGEQERIEDKPR